MASDKSKSFIARHWRLAVFVALLLGAAFGYRLSGLKSHIEAAHGSGIDALRFEVLSWGAWGRVGFVAVYVAFVTFALPNLPFQLAAGAIFGVGPAYAMMLIGVNIGALTAFSIARLLGRRSIEELLGSKIASLNEMIGRGGFQFVLTLRLIPLMPFNAINYAAGVSRLKLREYLAANGLGMIPLTFLHVLFGHAAASVDLHDSRTWLTPGIIAPVLLSLVALGIAGSMAPRLLKKRP